MDINFQAKLTMVTMYQYGEQMVIKVEQAAPKAKENVVTISGLEMDKLDDCDVLMIIINV